MRIAAIGCIPGVLSTSMRAELREIKKRSPQARFSYADGRCLLWTAETKPTFFYSQLSRDAAHPTMGSLNRYVGRLQKTARPCAALTPIRSPTKARFGWYGCEQGAVDNSG